MIVELDDFEEGLQAEMDAAMRAAYGEAVFLRWKRPPNMGDLDDANAQASVQGQCGDVMTMSLRIEDGLIKKARFRTTGCGSSQVCGSMAAELAEGWGCEGIVELSGDTVLEALGNVMPPSDQHCAFLAANALHEAVGDYYRRLRGE